jgi:hypothetical protein
MSTKTAFQKILKGTIHTEEVEKPSQKQEVKKE